MYSDDELEYEDVEDRPDDDEDYIDADEDDSPLNRLGSARSPGSGSSPFGSRTSSGGSPFASRSSSGGSPFSSRTSGSGTPFGSRSSDSDDDKPSSGGSSTFSPRTPSGGGGSFSSARSGSSPFSSRGGSPFGSGSAAGGNDDKKDEVDIEALKKDPDVLAAVKAGDTQKAMALLRKKNASLSFVEVKNIVNSMSGSDASKPASSGSSPSFSPRSGGSSFSPRKPATDGDKPSTRSSFGSSSASGSSGLPGKGGSPFGRSGAAKPDDKKPAAKPDKPADDDDKSKGRLGGLRSAFSFGGGGGDDDNKPKKDDSGKKPDDDNSGGGLLGGAVGGLRSRLPFGGGKSDDDDKKPEKAAGKPAAKPDDKSGGGLGSRLPFNRRGTGDAKSEDDGKKAKSGGESPKFGSRGKPTPKTTADKSAGKDDGEAKTGGGFSLGGIAAAIPFVGRGSSSEEKKPRSKTAREQDKTPQVKGGLGLTLDRKLDILGAGLLLGSIALLLSRLSPTQGILTQGINNLLGQLLGWGAFAVPLSMFGIGLWLIIRHFGDEPPTVDTERLIGLGITYVGLLVMFQFIRSLSYQNIVTYADLEVQTRLSWEALNNGGGWVGGNLYLLLVQYLGEVLAFSVNIFVLLVGVMFLLDLSLSEIAIIIIGLYRSFRSAQRRSNERRKVRRAERLTTRRQQVDALVASNAGPNIEVSKPRAEALGPGSTAALPDPGSDRAIPITMGGRTVTTNMKGDSLPAGSEVQPAQAADSSGGRRGGLLGALPFGGGAKPTTSPPPNAPETAQSNTASSNTLGGLLGALPFGGSSSSGQASNPPTAAQPPTAPPSGQTSAQSTASAQSAPPTPPDTAPPAKATPFDAPFGKSATPPADPAANQPLTQSGEDTAADDATSSTAATPSRAERLDAIRKGEGKSVLATAPTPPKPEDSVPAAPTTTPTPPTTNGAQTTDAYGNTPTGPSAARPAEMKPPPKTPPGAPSAPTKLPAQRNWKLPNIDELLNEGSEQDFDRQFLVEQARIIEDTLKSFGAPGRVVEINTGPVITQYGVEPDYLQSRSGKKNRVKVSAIAQLDRDLQLALGAKSIRIEAPVPGKGYVGIEIPNAENALVSLKDVMQADSFKKIRMKSPLAIALGQSVDGTPISAALDSMPHLLIAGTTGSGKSVCINSIICSMIANNSPEDLKMIMVDPKRVELTGYNGVPHLVAPVVVELERIVGVLKWVTREMDERYKRFSNAGARNIIDFNKHLTPGEEKMPYIVVIIDELADLMMLAPEETERTITRIAALARATGIHLVIATQRPSVDVVTGLIKANFPARIAFAVAGSVDSRVILDQPGAERLLGRGDMLYLSGDSPAPMRLQGVFVSDEEIDNITRYWKTQGAGIAPAPTKKMAPLSLDPSSAPRQMTPSGISGVPPSFGGASTNQQQFWETPDSRGGASDDDGDEPNDDLFDEAVELVRRQKKASVSMLQRKLRIGYTRASRLIEMMEQQGVIGPQESGSKPREVLPE